jgi:hypothetical protein
VYNLCLCSKIFFREIIGDNVASSIENKSEVLDAVGPSPTIKHLLKCGFSLAFLSDQTDDQIDALKKKYGPKLGGSSSVLATQLLRSSLLASLGRVLEHSESGITLEAAMSLGDLPDGSAIIAGSTMVQACLGVLWEGRYEGPPDVDIFCSADCAPLVRSVSSLCH